jgi:acyl carrier protein phosphodiesterase
MNHLAHLYLSQTNLDLLVGNFIADQVKGKALKNYSEGVQRGIEMHRAIDTYTDQHPVVLQSKERLYAKYHKYAAVIVDMYYDHLLAKHWADYSPIPLSLFAANCYKTLNARRDQMPERSKRILYYMERGDWLTNYGEKEGLERALQGLASRAKFDSKMEESVADLYQDWDWYEAEFMAFFKELYEFSRQW